MKGLSPRVRGNRAAAANHAACIRPIPACAGQPASRSSSVRLLRAYPRVCGATQRFSKHVDNDRGLSPRVRGNRVNAAIRGNNQGPIPACAGQPHHGINRHTIVWAYPRVCGATRSFSATLACGRGLSPRVRGNPFFQRHLGLRTGPIPACAGQPCRYAWGQRSWGAYPRVCGATVNAGDPDREGQGLSPRVRGNRYAK